MKILEGVKEYEVREANFEALRLALAYLGDEYPPAYFHGVAGTVFRIGGICPCAPTCTMAMGLPQLITLLGYEYEELPYAEATSEADVARMIEAVRSSIDGGVPALVWNAFVPCEWCVVTGCDETEKTFYGRVPWQTEKGEYAKAPWEQARENAGLTGVLAIILKEKAGSLNRRQAEQAALREAARHANDLTNVDKMNGGEWVFLSGRAAYNRWAGDFTKPDKERGLGDAYCLDIYASCHARAGEFLRQIAPGYADDLLEAAQFFDREVACLKRLFPYLSWDTPEKDAERNQKAYPLLKEAAENYGRGIETIQGIRLPIA